MRKDCRSPVSPISIVDPLDEITTIDDEEGFLRTFPFPPLHDYRAHLRDTAIDLIPFLTDRNWTDLQYIYEHPSQAEAIGRAAFSHAKKRRIRLRNWIHAYVLLIHHTAAFHDKTNTDEWKRPCVTQQAQQRASTLCGAFRENIGSSDLHAQWIFTFPWRCVLL
jgi:hypothetical protein